MHSPPWRLAGLSVIGARHERHGIVCQDASRYVSDDEVIVVAVADGHGDPRHKHSDRGARIAVEVACQVLWALGEDLLEDGESLEARSLEKRLQGHLARRIAWEWNRRVKAELHLDSSDGTWHKDTDLYGTTLLAALILDEVGIFFQLGDGDIVVSTDHGVHCLTEPDEALYGSLTHSLCQQDASSNAVVRCVDLSQALPFMVLLATDGVRDSLGPEAFLRLAPWFCTRVVQEGWEGVVEGLPEWLRQLSLRGNGDDCTLGLICWEDDLVDLNEADEFLNSTLAWEE